LRNARDVPTFFSFFSSAREVPGLTLLTALLFLLSAFLPKRLRLLTLPLHLQFSFHQVLSGNCTCPGTPVQSFSVSDFSFVRNSPLEVLISPSFPVFDFRFWESPVRILTNVNTASFSFPPPFFYISLFLPFWLSIRTHISSPLSLFSCKGGFSYLSFFFLPQILTHRPLTLPLPSLTSFDLPDVKDCSVQRLWASPLVPLIRCLTSDSFVPFPCNKFLEFSFHYPSSPRSETTWI